MLKIVKILLLVAVVPIVGLVAAHRKAEAVTTSVNVVRNVIIGTTVCSVVAVNVGEELQVDTICPGAGVSQVTFCCSTVSSDGKSGTGCTVSGSDPGSMSACRVSAKISMGCGERFVARPDGTAMCT